VYVGSDDGKVYCLNAADGQMVWSHRAAESERMIPSNGKMISLWPCRTGVLIQDGKAFFGASLVPWNPSWLCAVDIKTGKPIYTIKLSGVTLQGATLASAETLYMPQGRGTPLRYALADGKGRGALGGGGGVFCLLTEDDQFITGPNSQKPVEQEIRFFGGAKDQMMMSFRGANRILVAGDRAFIHQKDELVAVDRTLYASLVAAKKKDVSSSYLWRKPHVEPFSYILAGKHLWVGSEGRVTRFDADSGASTLDLAVVGRPYGLAAANGRLFVSTDRGAIYCFAAELR
ncbi:MAG: PQQ-binding-like beta-propeller repeat protein, partial [Verrucomicrobiota bacterium]